MIPLSFVICTTGARRSLLDEVVIPAIFEQPLDELEIVLVGSYAGRHRDAVTVVEAPTGAEVFYKPFQQGALTARHPWLVDLDDDMLLEADWGERLRAARIAEAGIHGFRMMHPDGTLFGTHFDAVDNRLSGRRRATSYFSSYLAPTDLFRRVPYPTYPSGDRAHALRIRAAAPGTRRSLLSGVRVVHLGQAAGQPGLTPKTTMEQVQKLRPVLRFLAEHGVAWMPFADRHLDGRPDVTLEAVWEAARAAVDDPTLRQRHHWLL